MLKRIAVYTAALFSTFALGDVHMSAEDAHNDNPLAEFVQRILLLQSERATDKSWQKARYDAWLMLCFELREDADCSGVPVPQVYLFKPNPIRPGLMGQYRGGEIVFMRNNLKGKQRLEVMAHEMSHYLDSLNGILPELPVHVNDKDGVYRLCLSEKIAWGVSDAFNRKYGDRKEIVGKDWLNWYGHCRPFKDRLYP